MRRPSELSVVLLVAAVQFVKEYAAAGIKVPLCGSDHAAVALIVIDVFIVAGGISLSSARMWPRCATGTPTLPTSPRAMIESGSYPVCVGRSNAIDSPVWPFARLVRYNSLLFVAVECPE